MYLIQQKEQLTHPQPNKTKDGILQSKIVLHPSNIVFIFLKDPLMRIWTEIVAPVVFQNCVII